MTRTILLCLNITREKTKHQKRIRRSFSDTRLFRTKYINRGRSQVIDFRFSKKVEIVCDLYGGYDQIWTLYPQYYKMEEFSEDLEILDFIHKWTG